MGSFIVKNNVESLVADNPLAQAATTLNVTTGGGTNFPSTFPFLITLWDDSAFPDPGDDSGMEIVKCTGRTTDALTIVRAQEGTADVAHALGECVAMLITAGIIDELCSTADAMLLDGTQAMSANLNMNGNDLIACPKIQSNNETTQLYLHGSTAYGGAIILYGENNATFPGDIRFYTPDAAKTNWVLGMVIGGVTDTPIVTIPYGLDMNTKNIDDVGAIILDSTELTIATGVVTVSRSSHTIDTESDAATDDLVTINGGTTGQILILRAASSIRTVVVKDTADNIRLAGGDMTLNHTEDTLTLFYANPDWLEISRADNAA